MRDVKAWPAVWLSTVGRHGSSIPASTAPIDTGSLGTRRPAFAVGTSHVPGEQLGHYVLTDERAPIAVSRQSCHRSACRTAEVFDTLHLGTRTLQPVLEGLRADLGLPPGSRLTAELHSMLVYRAGQFFVPLPSLAAGAVIRRLLRRLPPRDHAGAQALGGRRR